MRIRKMRIRRLLCVWAAICLVFPLITCAEEPNGGLTDLEIPTFKTETAAADESEQTASEPSVKTAEKSTAEEKEDGNEVLYTDGQADFPNISDGQADTSDFGAEMFIETEDTDLSETAISNEGTTAVNQSAGCDMRMVSAPSVPRADEADENICMVLTGESFENARFSRDANPSGAFNGKYETYLLAQSGDLQDRKSERTVYIPADGWYYVGARMKTTRTDTAQTSYYRNRTMQVSFTQNGTEYFVEGSKPWRQGCEYDFDSYVTEQGGVYRDVNVYLFGAGREFVSGLKSYNYTDAKPVFLKAGETTITLYGNSYARLDFLVVSKQPMKDVKSKSEYNACYGRFENPGQMAFEANPYISSDKIMVCPTDGTGCIVRELYMIDWNDEHCLLFRTTEDSIDLSNLRYDTPLVLYVKAWNMHGYSVTSQTVKLTDVNIDTISGDANISVNANNKFRTTQAFTTGYPSFKPAQDPLCGDAYGWGDGKNAAYTLLNTTDGVPLKHTTRVFVPKSGTYYVRARVPAYYSDKRRDIKYGTFTMSFVQSGREEFVQGCNPADSDSDLQSVGKFDSLRAGDSSKYLFGAMRDFVSDYKGYAYFDAQPIFLEKGYADVNLYAYQGAAVNYIVVSEHKPTTEMTKSLFSVSDYCYQSRYHAQFNGAATGSFENGQYSVALPDFYGTGAELFGVTANGKYESFGCASSGDKIITTNALADSSYRAVALVVYDDLGYYDEQRLPVSDSNVTYVITPNNTFENDPTDIKRFPNSIWRRNFITPEYGDTFNRAASGDIMRTYEAIGHGPKDNDYVYRFALKTTVKIYIPHSGRYKISARTASASAETTGVPEADRLFCVGVKQKNKVQAVGSYENSIFLPSARTVDGFGGNPYAFGYSKGSGAKTAFYNYDKSLLLNLTEGMAEISLYGFGNVRLDYIAITDYDMSLPETSEEYGEILYPYEDINLPYLDGEPNIIKNEDGGLEIEAYAKDASGQSVTGLSVYACKGTEKILIGHSDADSVLCTAEIKPNSEICIRAENSIGAYKEYYFNISGLNHAQVLAVGDENTTGSFEFARDSDYYTFTSSTLPSTYEIFSDKKNIYDFMTDVYRVENNTLIHLFQWRGDASRLCRIESPASAEPITYLIRVTNGMNVGDYIIGVKQATDNLEAGRFVKKAVKGEFVFAYVAMKRMVNQENKTVTVEYDPYQLTLLNALEGTGTETIRPGTYGNIQITESSLGRITFKYINRFPSDSLQGRTLNILKFISETDGTVNLKFDYTNE